MATQDFEKIVRTDALHQQETGIGLGTVGNKMGGFPSYVISLADGELTAVGRGSGFDRQRALEHKIPIGHRTVEVPGDRLARRQGEKARLYVAADRYRLDRFDRVSRVLRHDLCPSTIGKQLVAVTLQPLSRRPNIRG